MPKKKNDKVNYDGKDISLDMLSDLDKTKKALEQNLKLQKQQTEELKKQGKLTEELAEKRRKQYEQDKKFYDNLNRNLNATAKEQKEIFTNLDKNRDIFSNSVSKVTNKQNINNTKFTSLNSWYSNRVTSKQEEAYKEIAQRLYNEETNNGKKRLSQKQADNLKTKIEAEFTQSLSESIPKTTAIANIFKVATDTFNTAVQTWVSVAKNGLNNQVNAYETTFENISVRNGTTRDMYYGAQSKITDTLNTMGLYNNIASSEVQQMWNTMANSGLRVDLSKDGERAQITARAIETVLTQHIVPYLDVSSSSTQLLADNNPNFLKQVSGIGRATTEMVGSSTFITKYLQDLTDNVAPMAELAKQELGLQFAQLSGSYEYLRSKRFK